LGELSEKLDHRHWLLLLLLLLLKAGIF